MSTLRSKLEATIRERHLLGHSFYKRWQRGELTLPELQGYAKEYYSFEREFPRFLSAIHSRCEDAEARQLLLENLIDEERGAENHPELWLRFAEGLGVSREEVRNHAHSEDTEALLSVFRRHSRSPKILAGLAALFAYERQQPEVAKQKMEGLRRFYNVTDKSTVAFFEAHQTYDVEHAETEALLLSQLCRTKRDEYRVLGAATDALSALHRFLDGIERQYAECAL